MVFSNFVQDPAASADEVAAADEGDSAAAHWNAHLAATASDNRRKQLCGDGAVRWPWPKTTKKRNKTPEKEGRKQKIRQELVRTRDWGRLPRTRM